MLDSITGGFAHKKGVFFLADRWMGWQPHTTASHQWCYFYIICNACNKRRTHILLTLYVDVHVLPHALPDGVGGKAGVRARVVPDD